MALTSNYQLGQSQAQQEAAYREYMRQAGVLLAPSNTPTHSTTVWTSPGTGYPGMGAVHMGIDPIEKKEPIVEYKTKAENYKRTRKMKYVG